MFDLETTLSKNPHHIENSQPICKANQLNVFNKARAATERYFRTHYNAIFKTKT